MQFDPKTKNKTPSDISTNAEGVDSGDNIEKNLTNRKYSNDNQNNLDDPNNKNANYNDMFNHSFGSSIQFQKTYDNNSQTLLPPKKINGLIEFMKKDLKFNLSVVTFPGCFSNTIWRLMNLYHIATQHSPFEIVWHTAYEIATVVFAVVAFLDIMRQIVNGWSKFCSINNNSNTHHNNESFSSSFSQSLQHRLSVCDAIQLGFKFYLGVVGWTIGYVAVANEHPLYSRHGSLRIFYHSLGAGAGNFLALFIACELIDIIKYFWYQNMSYYCYYYGCKNCIALKNVNKQAHQRFESITMEEDSQEETNNLCCSINHRTALGIGTKAFLEGMLWSVLADEDFSQRLNQLHNTNAQNIIDALTVGIISSLGFSFMGLITSICGYFYSKKRNNDDKMQPGNV